VKGGRECLQWDRSPRSHWLCTDVSAQVRVGRGWMTLSILDFSRGETTHQVLLKWQHLLQCRSVCTVAVDLYSLPNIINDQLNNHHHHTTTVLRPFFQDHPGEPVPEENFWALWCKGRLTEADTPTIRLGATPSGLTRAHLHHPPTINLTNNQLSVAIFSERERSLYAIARPSVCLSYVVCAMVQDRR